MTGYIPLSRNYVAKDLINIVYNEEIEKSF